MNTKKNTDQKLNRDPLSGTPGAHPLGAGVGAAGAGAMGAAALGALAGPVGAVAGAIVGGLLGGLAGKDVAEGVNPTTEEAHWQKHYTSEPYVEPGMTYEDYGPAYRLGYETYPKHREDSARAEREMETAWENARGESRLDWEKAKLAARASYARVATANAKTVRLKK